MRSVLTATTPLSLARRPARIRVRTENAQLLDLAAERVERLADAGVGGASLEIDEEHVVAERGPPRPRLDARQVHAAIGELAQRMHQPTRRLVATTPEHQRGLAVGAWLPGVRRRGEPDEAGRVVGVVLDVGDEDSAAVQLGGQARS